MAGMDFILYKYLSGVKLVLGTAQRTLFRQIIILQQGSETSGRNLDFARGKAGARNRTANLVHTDHYFAAGLGDFREKSRFLLGRMEETGKKVFLPEGSKNWKKAEETGRNTCCQKCMQTRSSQILRSNTGTSIQIAAGLSVIICISQNSGILQGSTDLLSDFFFFFSFHDLIFKSGF